ncbi:MAG: 16S rRNA (guanine(966)-N(2))-methyltransferase RsmD [Burkholderiales bacterium]
MNRLRIIGGEWRSRLVEFPDTEGLRPTPDRVRETLFNWLGQTLRGKTCLDLFAGSGALGFEALSRGADKVTMVEADRHAAESLKQNGVKLAAQNLQIHHGDALQYLRGKPEAFDVVFLDPPYEKELHAELLKSLPPALKADGLVYLEDDKPLVINAPWQIIKNSRAGQVHFALIGLTEKEES